eukprot:768694-Hanusia_phi.AAC.1
MLSNPSPAPCFRQIAPPSFRMYSTVYNQVQIVSYVLISRPADVDDTCRSSLPRRQSSSQLHTSFCRRHARRAVPR